MDYIWSIWNKNETENNEQQHRQVTKPINITLLTCAFKSVVNIYDEIACVNSWHEYSMMMGRNNQVQKTRFSIHKTLCFPRNWTHLRFSGHQNFNLASPSDQKYFDKIDEKVRLYIIINGWHHQQKFCCKTLVSESFIPERE